MFELNPNGARKASSPVAPFKATGQTPTSLDPLNVAIARLSDVEVARMNRDDLIDLVSYSVLDQASIKGQARLDFVEDSQLKRLACLARFMCRRKVNSAFAERGRPSPFLDCI